MRFWAGVALALVAIFAVNGCNDYGNTFQANTGAFLQYVSPSNVNAGGPDVTITLTGSGFVPQTYVTWNQKTIATTVTTDPSSGNVISITAVVPAADTAKPGTDFVQTVNPHSGAGYNGLSNPVAFVVNPPPNPVPTITSIAPGTAAAGSASLTLTITGTNFIQGSNAQSSSQVNWNTTSQTSLAVTNITSTQIQAAVPATLLAAAGTATVTVYNPPVPPPANCVPGVNCGGDGGAGNGGGGTSPCPVASVCTFTITAGGNAAANAAVEEETPAVSADGRYVAYAAAQDGHSQIFARDTCQGAASSCQARTLLISAAADGTAGNDDSHAPSMSSDGRYVAFSSVAANLASEAGAPSGRQVYLRDTCFGVSGSCTPSSQLISTDPNGALVGTEAILPSVSSSGRYVAFLAVTLSNAKSGASPSTAKANSANSGVRQVFVRDTCLGAKSCTPSTTRISLQPGDTSGVAKPAGPAISGTANHVAVAGGNTASGGRRRLSGADKKPRIVAHDFARRPRLAFRASGHPENPRRSALLRGGGGRLRGRRLGIRGDGRRGTRLRFIKPDQRNPGAARVERKGYRAHHLVALRDENNIARRDMRIAVEGTGRLATGIVAGEFGA